MGARLTLLWYHGRLGLSWAALVPIVALAATVAILTLTAPPPQRGHDFAMALEGGLPIVAALLAAPLLMAERERATLPWLAVRAPLPAVLAVRLALLALYLLACCGLAFLVAGLLWGVAPPWAAMLWGGARAVAFVSLAALAASWSRATVHGYIAAAASWLGVLTFGSLMPGREPWLTFNPFAWSAGYSADVVAHSMILYTAIGLLLLLPQRALLRPERLLRQI